MKTRFCGAALCALLAMQSAAPAFASALRYPAAPRDGTTDTYFGTTVPDPYRPSAPVLLRVDTRSGHGGGKPTAKIIDDYADIYAFLVKNLNVAVPAGY